MNKPNEGLMVKQPETPSFVLEGIIVLNANKFKKNSQSILVPPCCLFSNYY